MNPYIRLDCYLHVRGSIGVLHVTTQPRPRERRCVYRENGIEGSRDPGDSFKGGLLPVEGDLVIERRTTPVDVLQLEVPVGVQCRRTNGGEPDEHPCLIQAGCVDIEGSGDCWSR